MNACAFTVSTELDPISPSEARPMRAYVNYATDSPTVQVFTYEERFDAQAQKVRELASEAAFDLVLAC